MRANGSSLTPPPLKQGSADIYMHIYIYVCMYREREDVTVSSAITAILADLGFAGVPGRPRKFSSRPQRQLEQYSHHISI